MAETTYRGQLNLPDMVTRLLLSVAITGPPRSFHPPGPDGARARSHFDGLPVDFVDQAISTIGADVANHYRTYHVVNHHDDGIGLDEYVDWIAEAGRPDRAHRRPRHLAPPLRIGASQPPRIAERTIVTVS